jgi:hypothetical protein
MMSNGNNVYNWAYLSRLSTRPYSEETQDGCLSQFHQTANLFMMADAPVILMVQFSAYIKRQMWPPNYQIPKFLS